MHTKSSLMAFIDEEPVKHQAKCECGFTTKKYSDFGAALAELKSHREANK